jgi:hypothetical protein
MASVFTRLAPIATLLRIVSRSRAYGWIDDWQAGITHSQFSLGSRPVGSWNSDADASHID